MNGNGRPVGTRTRIRLLVAIVLLAWATQTLVHQWGFGAVVPTVHHATGDTVMTAP